MKKALITAVAAVGILCTAVAVMAHKGHSHPKDGVTAATTKKTAPAASAKIQLPAASVTPVNLIGELVDPQCWFTHNGEGKEHVTCAVACAKGGQDLAFLDSRTGEIHTLLAASHGTNPNDGLYEHVGVPVRARGTLYKRGTNSGLLMEKIELVK